MSGMFEEVYQGILDGDREQVKEGVKKALEEKNSAEAILKEGMMTAMAEVGRLFEEGEYFVPELLVAARGHARRAGYPQAASGGGGCGAGRDSRDWYGQRRPARHRQEPGRYDDAGRGLRN